MRRELLFGLANGKLGKAVGGKSVEEVEETKSK